MSRRKAGGFSGRHHPKAPYGTCSLPQPKGTRYLGRLAVPSRRKCHRIPPISLQTCKTHTRERKSPRSVAGRRTRDLLLPLLLLLPLFFSALNTSGHPSEGQWMGQKGLEGFLSGRCIPGSLQKPWPSVAVSGHLSLVCVKS